MKECPLKWGSGKQIQEKLGMRTGEQLCVWLLQESVSTGEKLGEGGEVSWVSGRVASG